MASSDTVAPVSNAGLDISFAVADHLEHSLSLTEPAIGIRFGSLDENVFVAGQIADSADALEGIKQRGIKTVFNIRCANEAGYEDLSKKLETHGIAYKHCPINYKEPKVQDVDALLGQLDQCEKPCLIFCEVGLRAAAMGIAFKTARQRAAQALNGSLGTEACALMEPDDAKFLDGLCTSEEDSQLMTFVASYVAQKVTNCCNRPGVSKICEKVFLAGQLSEEELQSLATKEGCKSVLNMRNPEEAGQFGLGMLAKEKEIVEGLGLKYVNVPVPREGNYEIELCKKVSDALQDLLATHSPVIVHCRTGGRVKNILAKSMEIGLLDHSPCKPVFN